MPQSMRRLLHKHNMCVNGDVESILGARVPIIKFKDRLTGEILPEVQTGTI